MIYLDSSLVMAYLLAEDRCPPASIWHERLVSSRLLEYEVWNRIHVYRPAATSDSHVEALLGRVQFIEMTPVVLKRAMRPFPVAVPTLDSLHLATAVNLLESDLDVTFATFDARLLAAARALDIPLYDF